MCHYFQAAIRGNWYFKWGDIISVVATQINMLGDIEKWYNPLFLLHIIRNIQKFRKINKYVPGSLLNLHLENYLCPQVVIMLHNYNYKQTKVLKGSYFPCLTHITCSRTQCSLINMNMLCEVCSSSLFHTTVAGFGFKLNTAKTYNF